MSRDSRLYLEDILEAATRVRTYLAGASRQTLDSDLRTRDAVLHNLEVIGEAVKKLPDDLPEGPQRLQSPRVTTMGIEELLSENRPAILRAAKAHGAGNVRVFGSVARGEASADSDVDLLVDLEPGRSLLDHAALVIELEALLGRKVDIAIARGLRSRIRDRVLKEAIPL
jgi:predicted nucleotidyltransferase